MFIWYDHVLWNMENMIAFLMLYHIKSFIIIIMHYLVQTSVIITLLPIKKG